MTIEYVYSLGKLIDFPQTYFYSEYLGPEFFDAWYHSRQEVLNRLPNPLPPRPVDTTNASPTDVVSLLEKAYAGDSHLREQFRRKYETTKRVHSGYDRTFKAIDKTKRHDLDCYIRLTDVFELAYAETGSIQYLNVLLKIIDTLCAYSTKLSATAGSHLAWHLIAERKHVEMLLFEKCNRRV